MEKGFNKNRIGLSTIDEKWLRENATSSQLLSLLREEGDDLSMKDRDIIDKILTERFDKGKGVGGRVLEGEELESLKQERNAFNLAQQEYFQSVFNRQDRFMDFNAATAEGISTGMGNSLQNLNYYSNIIKAEANRTQKFNKDQQTLANTDQ